MNSSKYYFCTLLLILSLTSCIKWNLTHFRLPEVTTSKVDTVLNVLAMGGGNVISDGGYEIIARGVVCSDTSKNPTIVNASKKTALGSGTGSFTHTITGLVVNIKYYVRAYATNTLGTAYGDTVSFTTKIAAPLLSTATITDISPDSATSGGNVRYDGGATVTARGVCWGTKPGPTINSSKTPGGTGTGPFSCALSGLKNDSIYYVRAYATNSIGTSYGNELKFTAKSSLATLTTTGVVTATQTTATGGGNITDDGGSVITARGVCWSTKSGPTLKDSKTSDGTGTGSFTSTLEALTTNTTYYVRAYATNILGTSYGNEIVYKAGALYPPTLTTSAVSLITRFTATCGGNISSHGGAPVTERGVCWNTSTAPTTSNNKLSGGTGTGIFTVNLTGLLSSTTYYVRAYATNSVGTAYGDEQTFTTRAFDIGQSYGGGIIFYIDGTGLHGMIASTSNLSSTVRWNNSTQVSTGTDIGTGLTNTSSIITASGTGASAAQSCKSYTGGGFNDWYLPSKDELNQMFLNRALIGGLTSGEFWSSSESAATTAWTQTMTNGTQTSGRLKSGLYYVRPIRNF